LDDPNDLLRRCQRGDESALAGLVRHFGGRVFRLACRVLGDPGRAEEATADVFAKVWSAARQWRGDADAGTWTYRVAYRTVLDHQRRRRPVSPPPPADLPDPRPGPAEQSARADEQATASRRVHEALARLPETDRTLVHLYYFEQMPLAEVAAVVGATRDVLKMRLARARQKLRDLLGDDEGFG
jgi:RNA polymerase sigma-70 factor (ECF subfamily)